MLANWSAILNPGFRPPLPQVILEDNDAVIKMCIKERSPSMKHVARTHRVNLDWLFERLNRDPAVLRSSMLIF